MTDKVTDWFGEGDKRAELRDIEGEVRTMLKTRKWLRNSDNELIREIWKWHPEVQASSILRARRKIQNKQGQYLPTDPKIARQRRINMLVFRDYYGVGNLGENHV